MLATAAPLLPALALAAVLPLATARAQADTMPSTFRPPPATDAEWRCQVLGKGCVCARPRRPAAQPWTARVVPGWGELIASVDTLTEQVCEIAALVRTVADVPHRPAEPEPVQQSPVAATTPGIPTGTPAFCAPAAYDETRDEIANRLRLCGQSATVAHWRAAILEKALADLLDAGRVSKTPPGPGTEPKETR